MYISKIDETLYSIIMLKCYILIRNTSSLFIDKREKCAFRHW